MAHEILVVDDEADIRTLVADILKDEGFSVRVAGSSDQALEAVRTRQPHLVLLDIWLQGSQLDGLQILEKIQSDHPGLPVVMMSGHGTIETAVGAIKQGAYDFVEKPFKSDHLLHVIDRAIEAAKLRREVADLKSRTTVEYDLTGASAVIAAVRQAIEKVAPTNSRVLITGAAGTGKEVVARAL
ncbi:MAG: sigma-54-dependent transcriptional regulator, partial [Elstera sp.]